MSRKPAKKDETSNPAAGQFNFSPEGLNISGGAYMWVRTFARRFKHYSRFQPWPPAHKIMVVAPS